jgi:hypothetical protein
MGREARISQKLRTYSPAVIPHQGGTHLPKTAKPRKPQPQNGQHGFVLHRDVAQYIHDISREEVRSLYLQHNGAAAEYLDSTYDVMMAQEPSPKMVRTRVIQNMKKSKPTKIWKAWMAIFMADLKSLSLTTQVSADSLTNKDGSDDQQDEGN